MQRCTSDQGRHSFVLGGLVGPNVFHDCVATRPYGSSEPHGSLIVGTLYDCVRAPLAFRVAKSAPPRWMGFNSFAWNCEGMFIVQKALAPDGTAAAQNYSIGHVGLNAMLYNRDLIDYDWPDGWIECVHSRVAPLAYSHDILQTGCLQISRRARRAWKPVQAAARGAAPTRRRRQQQQQAVNMSAIDPVFYRPHKNKASLSLAAALPKSSVMTAHVASSSGLHSGQRLMLWTSSAYGHIPSACHMPTEIVILFGLARRTARKSRKYSLFYPHASPRS